MPLRKALGNVEPYRPARPAHEIQRALGLDTLIKLASNEGAFGPGPAALDAYHAAAASLGRYPDGAALSLREALAERHGVAPAQVVIGNGADELIRLCAVVAAEAGDRVVHPWPSFPSYPASARVCGAEPVAVTLSARTADLDAMLAAAASPEEASLVYIANPNNPTGTRVADADLASFVAQLPRNALCVLDEAYAEYADPEPDGMALVRAGAESIAVLRTFSKVHGLAALRVGYAVASPAVADALDRVRPIFNVSQPAQAAALASLQDADAVRERTAHARAATGRLAACMSGAGLDPQPSQANFVYAEVPPAMGDGAALADRLMHQGVLVRALAGFGAADAIRVTAGTDEEMAVFEAALARVTAPGGASGPR